VDHGFLDRLGEGERAAVNVAMRRRTFRKGETLFHEGDPGDLLFTVERGRVAIRTTTLLGDVVTLTILGRGATFGELALVGTDSTRTASAVALEAVEVRALHRRDFDDLRARDPSVDALLVDVLAAQVRRVSNLLQDALFLPADRRVVRRLAELVELYRSDDARVDVPLRQDELASMAGTTRPTVNRVLRKLEAEGVVALRRGQVTVIDPSALAHRAR
jgi:CRP/FNR family transcriptional regulator, cyclic AMP receptor protein